MKISLLNGLVIYDRLTCGFPIENIPLGVCSIRESRKFICTRVGNCILNLDHLALIGVFSDAVFSRCAQSTFSKDTLNEFLSLGKNAWSSFRRTLQRFLREPTLPIEVIAEAIYNFTEENIEEEVRMYMPVSIGGYTDFYASKEHATNVGIMFRGKENALNPNWTHLPVGYHGRSSSIVVSGTNIKRPCGQIKGKEGPPCFGKSEKLDFELEMGVIIGQGNLLGERIPIDQARDHIYGMVLLNDWSARDIQAWEYVPLGPFLGKNFGTTISPWIISLDALEPFRIPKPMQDPSPLEYLQESEPSNYDISLKVLLKVPELANEEILLSDSNLKYLYWSVTQQVAHHTVNGCNLQTGDLLGTGTISGPERSSFGSLLELSWNGTTPIVLPSKTSSVSRTFLQDNDTVIMTAYCQGSDYLISFGQCTGTILSNRSMV